MRLMYTMAPWLQVDSSVYFIHGLYMVLISWWEPPVGFPQSMASIYRDREGQTAGLACPRAGLSVTFTMSWNMESYRYITTPIFSDCLTILCDPRNLCLLPVCLGSFSVSGGLDNQVVTVGTRECTDPANSTRWGWPLAEQGRKWCNIEQKARAQLKSISKENLTLKAQCQF